MADVGHYMFTKSVFYTPHLLKKNTSELPVSIVLMRISLKKCLNACYDEKQVQI